MWLLRWFGLPVVIGAILAAFAFAGHPQPGLAEQLIAIRERNAASLLQQDRPTAAAALPLVPTPTDTTMVQDTPTSTGTSTATTTSTPVPSRTDTLPAASETPTPTATIGTGAMLPTQTPTPPSMPTDSAPTATPTVDRTLPDIAPTPDEAGAAVVGVVTSAGGRLASGDGRVILDFPASAVEADTTIQVRRLPVTDYLPSTPDERFVGIWEFTAADVATGAQRHRFSAPVRFTFRFGFTELAGLESRNLAFWTFDEASGAWRQIPVSKSESALLVVADVDHFSVDAITATSIIDVASLLDEKSLDLQSGASALAIPIQLPAGRGGLTPSLALNYNSGRLGEMRSYTSLGSWVGTGWDLDTPHISVSYGGLTADEASGGGFDKARVFLSLAGGIGGEIMNSGGQEPPATCGMASCYIWHARDEQYLKIRSACGYMFCQWIVWDKTGTKYSFGASATTLRTYRERITSTSTRIRTYRIDIDQMEDVLGNRVNFEYQAVTANDCSTSACPSYTMSQYLSRIRYNDDHVIVDFQTGCDHNTTVAGNANICIRNDVPYDFARSRVPGRGVSNGSTG